MANFISTKNEHFLIFCATIAVNEIVATGISMLVADVADEIYWRQNWPFRLIKSKVDGLGSKWTINGG